MKLNVKVSNDDCGYDKLNWQSSLQKIETRNAGNVVSLHFDKLTDTNVRLEIRAIRERELRPLKRSVVKIYHEGELSLDIFNK